MTDTPVAPLGRDKVVNLDTTSGDWSVEQVARELQAIIDDGEVQSVMVAIEYKSEHGHPFGWMGSTQKYNERVYLVTWLYNLMMRRVFG